MPKSKYPVGLFMLADQSQPLQIGGGTPPVVDQLGDADLLKRLQSDCFICRAPLVKGKNDSNEHIFPEWLFRAFDIEHESLNLLDGSAKKYKDVVVPCCKNCNNGYLNAVEQRLRPAVLSGFTAFREQSRSDLALWACKIMYGLLCLEVAPRHKKEKHLLPPTARPEVLNHLRLTKMLLAGFRKRVVIDAPAFPLSILLFSLKSGPPSKLAFNFRDSREWPTALALRLGSIGMIVSFEDFGCTERWYQHTLGPLIEGELLHPRQFAEIVAHAFYFGGQGGFHVKYTAMEGPADVLLTLQPIPVQGYPADPRTLAKAIATFSGISFDQLWDENAGRPRNLLEKGGRFRDMAFDDRVAYPL